MGSPRISTSGNREGQQTRLRHLPVITMAMKGNGKRKGTHAYMNGARVHRCKERSLRARGQLLQVDCARG